LSTLAQSNETVNPLPAPTGTYQVGTSLFHWVDETRFEIIPALVARNSLQPGTAVAKNPPTPIKAEAKVRADTLAMLDANQPVTVTEIDKSWAHIEYGDIAGWALVSGLINADTKRELMVQVWYPADVEVGAAPAAYLPDSSLMVNEFNTVIKVLYNLLLDSDLAASLEFRSYAFSDAPISSAQNSYPVLIFSHGLGGFPALYSAQLEEMASHGYIVFAIFHTYLTPITIFPDGRMVTFSLPRSLDFYPGIDIHRIASEDQIFVANQLQALNNVTDNVFAGKMDLESLGVFGHSMGGSAAVFSCYNDSRFHACLNEDGFSNLLYEMNRGILQPSVYMQKEINPDSMTNIYRSVRGPGYNLIIDGFGHLSFADFVWGPISSPDGEDILHRIWTGNIDGLRATRIVRAYLLAFFDTYLKGENNALLDGPSVDYPEVNFQSRNSER
ncbi:MAG: hypothetical protein L0154_19420, partial [Chloroflexi bacterium]|nr:hypothetical protein [Chloroflexota bacterium]